MGLIQQKDLPDPRRYDVIPPDMNHVYFEHADAIPLEPGNTDFSPANAWWFAECAFVTYCHPGFVRLAYRLVGFDGFRFFQGKGTECMVGWNAAVAVVSFRGTELKSRSALHEIGTDMDTRPVPFEGGGKVHQGFLKGLEEIWEGPDGLKTFLDGLMDEAPDRPLWITGHSLGGALATLCFARTPQAKGLYVFGAPRVGDQIFVDTLAGRPIWRVEHGRDPVPMFPPDLPKVNFRFRDPGQLVFITRDGRLLDARPVLTRQDHESRLAELKEIRNSRRQKISRSIAKAPRNVEGTRLVMGKISRHIQKSRDELKSHLDELNDYLGLKVDDHQPIFYVIKLWNALVRAD